LAVTSIVGELGSAVVLVAALPPEPELHAPTIDAETTSAATLA
jgi:hypothetical protein